MASTKPVESESIRKIQPVESDIQNNGHKKLTPQEIAEQVASMGFWFHNIDLGHGIFTCPGHPYGDFPRYKWELISSFIPEDLTGKTVLDVGCNAGFYSLEMKKRGAERVVGIDVDDHYLKQAKLASTALGLDIELRKLSVYDVDRLEERFDYVIFMGVLYHLRHPLYALDKLSLIVNERLIVQSLTRGEPGETEIADDYVLMDKDIFSKPQFPKLFFIERNYVHDASNWWIPNEAGLAAMLRSTGLRVVGHPEEETFICEPIENYDRWWM